MKVTMRKLVLAVCLAFMLASAIPALAGPPLVMLDGAGGVGVNQTAWITSSTADTSFLDGWIQKPTAAVWYGNFSEINTSFSAFGMNFGIKDRVELSYGRQTASIDGGPNIDVDSFGAKLLLVKENSFGSKFIPALSVGATYRINHEVKALYGTDKDNDGVEFYAVASKVVTQFPLFPLIFSGGVAYGDAQARGVMGFNRGSDEDLVGMFDFAAIVPLFRNFSYLKTVVPGFEYRTGAKYDNGYEDSDYWDIFFDFMVTDKIIVALGYLWNGDPNSGTNQSLGECPFFMVDIDW